MPVQILSPDMPHRSSETERGKTIMMNVRPWVIATFLLSTISCVDTSDEDATDKSTIESQMVTCCDGGGGGGSVPAPRPTPPPGVIQPPTTTPDTGELTLDSVAAAAGSGCSVVQYCDAPGSDGTRCLHLACDYNTAYNECIVETRNVCGTPVQPWIFVCRNSTCT
jgi:hypothetical protein